jgi:hypothetical protein
MYEGRNLAYLSLLTMETNKQKPFSMLTMNNISKTSRREFIAGKTLFGASSLVGASADLVPISTSQPSSDSS